LPERNPLQDSAAVPFLCLHQAAQGKQELLTGGMNAFFDDRSESGGVAPSDKIN
jgi:hypothetical protein